MTLVSIRTVNEITPIPNADLLELVRIDGWQCVVKKGDFKVGDQGVYFATGSILPSNDSRFSFLSARGWRIKTMRLRGTLSQGLLLPLTNFSDAELSSGDLTTTLGVTELQDTLSTCGNQAGRFPSFVPKTDAERIQNIPGVLQTSLKDLEVTEKLDGTSFTAFRYDGEFGICSRNFQMKDDGTTVYSQMARQYNLQDIPDGFAIQGEIIGPKIQGNKYKLPQARLFVFDVYDIQFQRKLNSKERVAFVNSIGLDHVPILTFDYNFDLDAVLNFADGASVVNPDVLREGVVFKFSNYIETRRGNLSSFKVISNKWLLKYE